MLYNINPLPLQRVFHGIRFKVNEDWVSGIDTLLFLYTLSICFSSLFHEKNFLRFAYLITTSYFCSL